MKYILIASNILISQLSSDDRTMKETRRNSLWPTKSENDDAIREEWIYKASSSEKLKNSWMRSLLILNKQYTLSLK